VRPETMIGDDIEARHASAATETAQVAPADATGSTVHELPAQVEVDEVQLQDVALEDNSAENVVSTSHSRSQASRENILSTQAPSCFGAYLRFVLYILVAVVLVPILTVGMYIEDNLVRSQAQIFRRIRWRFLLSRLEDVLTVVRPWMRSTIGHRRCVWRFPTLEQELVLTLDDAPGDSPKEMQNLLDLLDENKVQVTFFVTTSYIHNGEMERLMQRIIDADHEIGNHMPEDKPYHHLSADAFRTQLLRAEEVLARFDPTRFGPTRTRRRWFRPPHGKLSKAMMRVLVAEDYHIAMGTVFSNDPAIGGLADPPVTSAMKYHEQFVIDHAKAGSIVIFHVPNKETRKQTIPVLTQLLAYWDEHDIEVQRCCDMAVDLEVPEPISLEIPTLDPEPVPRVEAAPVF